MTVVVPVTTTASGSAPTSGATSPPSRSPSVNQWRIRSQPAVDPEALHCASADLGLRLGVERARASCRRGRCAPAEVNRSRKRVSGSAASRARPPLPWDQSTRRQVRLAHLSLSGRQMGRTSVQYAPNPLDRQARGRSERKRPRHSHAATSAATKPWIAGGSVTRGGDQRERQRR